MKNGTRFQKLKREQREALLTWLIQDLSAYQIRTLAPSFNPPFRVTQQQIYYYRSDLGLNLEELETKIVAKARSAGFVIRGLARLSKVKKLVRN